MPTNEFLKISEKINSEGPKTKIFYFQFWSALQAQNNGSCKNQNICFFITLSSTLAYVTNFMFIAYANFEIWPASKKMIKLATL